MCRSIESPIAVPNALVAFRIKYSSLLLLLWFFSFFFKFMLSSQRLHISDALINKSHYRFATHYCWFVVWQCRSAVLSDSIRRLRHRNNNNSRCTVHMESGLDLVQSKSVLYVDSFTFYFQSLALAFTLHLSVDIFSCSCTIIIFFFNFRSLSSSTAASSA